jgi:flagellar hook assembly protein FlgD
VGIGQSENNVVPLAFALHQSRPNPLALGTTIRYALPRPAPVEVRIYGSAGTLVRRLVEGGQMAGYRRAYWNGCDDRGRRVAPGVYYCRFRAGEFHAAQKLVVQR